HVSRSEFCRQNALQKRDVLFHQLLLKVLCTGGDDDATAATCGGSYCGDQVSESFAGACSSLNDEMASVFKCAHDRVSHLNLARPIFIFRVRLSDKAFGTKNLLHFL